MAAAIQPIICRSILAGDAATPTLSQPFGVSDVFRVAGNWLASCAASAGRLLRREHRESLSHGSIATHRDRITDATSRIACCLVPEGSTGEVYKFFDVSLFSDVSVDEEHSELIERIMALPNPPVVEGPVAFILQRKFGAGGEAARCAPMAAILRKSLCRTAERGYGQVSVAGDKHHVEFESCAPSWPKTAEAPVLKTVRPA